MSEFNKKHLRVNLAKASYLESECELDDSDNDPMYDAVGEKDVDSMSDNAKEIDPRSRSKLRHKHREPKVAKTKEEKKEDVKRYSQTYNDKLKQNPNKYRSKRERDKEFSRNYRKQMTTEQKQRSRVLATERMRKYRALKKAEQNESLMKPIKTRNELVIHNKALIKQRTYWREQKRKHRSKMSPQASRRNNEKRRTTYRELKIKEAKGTTQTLDLADTPRKFGREMKEMLSNITPRKKKVVEELLMQQKPNKDPASCVNRRIVRNLKINIRKLKKDQTGLGRTKYRCFVYGIKQNALNDVHMRKTLGLSWDFWKSASTLFQNQKRDKRYGGMDDEEIQLIQDFFSDEGTDLPCMRTVSAKSLEQKKILHQSLSSLHEKYQKKSGRAVSLSVFKRLRPKKCITMSNEKFIQCLCEVCINIELKVKALNLKKSDDKPMNKFDIVNLTMCEREGEFPPLRCVNRECDNCGVDELNSLSEVNPNDQIKWKKWENVNTSSCNKMKSTHKALVEHTGTRKDCVRELAEETWHMSHHLFVAQHQRNQFIYLRDNLPPDTLLTVGDFAENYRCCKQDEPQSAHFNYEQATIHPIVAYYYCPDCHKKVEESIVFVSNDHEHDSDSVNHFYNILYQHIDGSSSREVKKVQFSDGCGKQYKSKRPFHNASLRENVELGFFGSRHGKSVCDALGGIVKKGAEQSVKSRRRIIGNASDFYQYCNDELTQTSLCAEAKVVHKRRTFFYVEKTEIDRSAKLTLEILQGTQKEIHSVKGVSPGNILFRNLSCFCNGCLTGGECINPNYVMNWQEHNLSGPNIKRKKIPKSTKKNTLGKTPSNSIKKPKSKKIIEAKKSVNEKKKATRQKKSETRKKLEFVVQDHEKTHGDKPVQPRPVLRRTRQSSRREMEESARNLSKRDKETKTKKSKKETTVKIRPLTRPSTNCEVVPLLTESHRNLPPTYIIYDMLEPLLLEQNLLVDYCAADGNCFFRSISKCIFGTESQHMKVRDLVVNLMIEKSQLFHQYVDGDYDRHVQLMAYRRAWATSAEIFATATLLKRDIYVFTPVTEHLYRWTLFPPTPNDAVEPILKQCKCHLSILHTSGNHYDRICSMDTGCNCRTAKPLLNTDQDLAIQSHITVDSDTESTENKVIPEGCAGDSPGVSKDDRAGGSPGVSEDDRAGGSPGFSEDDRAGGSPGVSEDDRAGGSPGVSEDDRAGGSPGVSEDDRAGGSSGVSEDDRAGGSPGVSEDDRAGGSPGVSEDDCAGGSPGVSEESKSIGDENVSIYKMYKINPASSGFVSAYEKWLSTSMVIQEDDCAGDSPVRGDDCAGDSPVREDDCAGDSPVREDDCAGDSQVVREHDRADDSQVVREDNCADDSQVVREDDCAGDSPVREDDCAGDSPVREHDCADDSQVVREHDCAGDSPVREDDRADDSQVVREHDRAGDSPVREDDRADDSPVREDDRADDSPVREDCADDSQVVREHDCAGDSPVREDDRADDSQVVREHDRAGDSPVREDDRADDSQVVREHDRADDSQVVREDNCADDSQVVREHDCAGDSPVREDDRADDSHVVREHDRAGDSPVREDDRADDSPVREDDRADDSQVVREDDCADDSQVREHDRADDSQVVREYDRADDSPVREDDRADDSQVVREDDCADDSQVREHDRADDSQVVREHDRADDSQVVREHDRADDSQVVREHDRADNSQVVREHDRAGDSPVREHDCADDSQVVREHDRADDSQVVREHDRADDSQVVSEHDRADDSPVRGDDCAGDSPVREDCAGDSPVRGDDCAGDSPVREDCAGDSPVREDDCAGDSPVREQDCADDSQVVREHDCADDSQVVREHDRADDSQVVREHDRADDSPVREDDRADDSQVVREDDCADDSQVVREHDRADDSQVVREDDSADDSQVTPEDGNRDSPVRQEDDGAGGSAVTPESKSMYKRGDYVLVLVDRRYKKGPPMEYPAEVITIDSNMLEVSFVKETHTAGVYKWPEKRDTSWITSKDILKRLNPPTMHNIRMGYIMFD